MIFMAPTFIIVVNRQPWSLELKRIVAGGLIVPLLGLAMYLMYKPIPAGSSVPEGIVKGIIILGVLWEVSMMVSNWPRAGGRPQSIKDIRALLSTTIPAAESQLSLTVAERSERRHPPEGVYSHYLTRYADGTWLEWLNPTDEKGEPNFSFYALYSNNKALVRVLAKALAPHCNVEHIDRPLWRTEE